MSSDTAQLVKSKIDIVDFLKQYLELKPAGKNFKAPCPFHKEKTPSFMVSPDRQTWHCFGTCNEGGDIITFLMKYENIEFYDALKILAEKAGVELRTAGDRDFQSSNNLYRVMEAAKEFFKSTLAQEQKIREYLQSRGLQEETVQEFEIGVAPDGSDTLTKQLIKSGFNILDIEKAGLALKTERGTYADRFRARVMFPIHNQVGKVVAFTGRVLPWNDSSNIGKYVNSPETPIFQKSKILYGFHKTKGEIRKEHKAVVVEGQMDLIMAWQDGIRNIVATSGTAMTNDHLILLSRLADELILSFDSDEAGQAAAERAIDLAGAADFSVKLLVIDDEKLKDPADMAKARPGHLKELIAAAMPAMEYYFHKYMKHVPEDMKLKKHQVRLVLGKIRALASPIDREHWLQELSYRAKISEEVLSQEMAALPKVAAAFGEPRASHDGREAAPSAAEKDPAEKRAPENISGRTARLMGIMLYLKKDLKELREHVQYFPEEYAEIYKRFIKATSDQTDDMKELMDAISMKFGFENQKMEAQELEKEIGLLLRQLKVEYYKKKLLIKGELIRELERAGDEQKLQKAMVEYAALSKELQES